MLVRVGHIVIPERYHGLVKDGWWTWAYVIDRKGIRSPWWHLFRGQLGNVKLSTTNTSCLYTYTSTESDAMQAAVEANAWETAWDIALRHVNVNSLLTLENRSATERQKGANDAEAKPDSRG